MHERRNHEPLCLTVLFDLSVGTFVFDLKFCLFCGIYSTISFNLEEYFVRTLINIFILIKHIFLTI